MEEALDPLVQEIRLLVRLNDDPERLNAPGPIDAAEHDVAELSQNVYETFLGSELTIFVSDNI